MRPMSCREVEPHLLAAAMGEAAPAAVANVEAHVADCPECRADLARYRAIDGMVDVRSGVRAGERRGPDHRGVGRPVPRRLNHAPFQGAPGHRDYLPMAALLSLIHCSAALSGVTGNGRRITTS